MITITREISGDDRPSKEDLLRNTKKHVREVDAGLRFFADMVRVAGDNHDITKIKYIDEFYDASSKGFGKIRETTWWRKHIREERHHLNNHCPEDVNLIDVIEFLTDCVITGSVRSANLSPVNLNSSILSRAFNNTVELLKKNITIEDE